MNVSAELRLRRKHAVLVSAALVKREENVLIGNFKCALAEAFTAAELAELILQSLLFDGYPCALEGFIVLNKIRENPDVAGEFTEKYSPENLDLWLRRGESLCRRIYGHSFSRLLRNVEALSPTLKEWMLLEGYGRVLARPALQMDIREMGIIVILTVKHLPRQLYSHLKGALHLGVPVAELRAAILLCRDYTEPRWIKSALEVWRKVSNLTPE